MPGSSKLNAQEQALFNKFSNKFKGMTEDDFLELRGDAVSMHSVEPKGFTISGEDGTLLEDK